jgi:tetratricopeptide (TPR) repeat protein
VARTIRTCSGLLAAALAVVPAAAEARATISRSGASIFVAARAAAESGDARRAAILYASLASAEPGNAALARRALGQAILAGDMPLALRLAKARPVASLAPDARLLLLAEQLKRGHVREREIGSWPAELNFMLPFVRAWLHAERGKTGEAMRALDGVAADNLLAPVVAEHKALILLRGGRADEARVLIPQALERAGSRSDRLRIAFASGLMREGKRQEGFALLQGRDPTLAQAAAMLSSEHRPVLPIASAAQGLSELLVGVALALNGSGNRSLPLALAQVARHSDPANPQATLLLALMLGEGGRSDEGLALLRALPEDLPFASDARDAEMKLLTDAGRLDEALARASAFALNSSAADDWARLGDTHDALKRHAQAAEAYGRAATLADGGAPGPERWTLHLLRGASLEQADRWPEAEKALEAAYALAPDNPVVLNYLGYARLERGEQLDEAEELIARASRLAPQDASITDSLGWAQFKRGRVAEAIATLQRAAAADPAQAEIHEHLGDALYTAGRKFEARHAWNAALVTAEDEVRKRVEAKIAAGLTQATAAP